MTEATAQMGGPAFRSRRREATPRPAVLAKAIPAPPNEAPLGPVPIDALRRPSTPTVIEDVYEREHLDLFHFIKGVVRDQASSGSSAREIGPVMGKSDGSVRMLVSRGRLRIRRSMAAADVVRSGGEASR